MRYYTFGVASPVGSLTRIGAEQGGRLVDLTAACAALFAHLQGCAYRLNLRTALLFAPD